MHHIIRYLYIAKIAILENNPNKIKVLIVDDHPIVLDAITNLISQEESVQIVGTAKNGKEALEFFKYDLPDLVILDISMPEMDGVETTAWIKENYPNVNILIFTMHDDYDNVRTLIGKGVNGYLLKNSGSKELLKAVKYINQGMSYISQEVTDILFEALRSKTSPPPSQATILTKREKEVLKLLSQGLSSKEIGDELLIAPSTVDTHRRNLIEKTGVSNSKQLVIYALKYKFYE